jgi:hypothetical protein
MLWLTLQLIATAKLAPIIPNHSANFIALPFANTDFVVYKLNFCYGNEILSW